jgi:hypothetical protein
MSRPAWVALVAVVEYGTIILGGRPLPHLTDRNHDGANFLANGRLRAFDEVGGRRETSMGAGGVLQSATRRAVAAVVWGWSG